MEIGDRIQCWTPKECSRKMMLLASKGIIADEEPKGSNCLVIKKISEDIEPGEWLYG